MTDGSDDWVEMPTIAQDSRLWGALEGPDEVWLGRLAHELGRIGVRAKLAKPEDQTASGRHPNLVVKCGWPEKTGGTAGQPAPLESEPTLWFPGKDGTMVSLRGDRNMNVLALEVGRFFRGVEDHAEDTVQDDLLEQQILEFQQRSNAPRPRPAPSFPPPPQPAQTASPAEAKSSAGVAVGFTALAAFLLAALGTLFFLMR